MAWTVVAPLADRMTTRDTPELPAWWCRAEALERDNRLDEAERTITEAVDHLGALASVAELYRLRMIRLAAAGDYAGAEAAADQAESWIRRYAGQATSGGEGAALSEERDRFIEQLGRNPASADETPPVAETPLDRFTRSMERNRERWLDGIGYDLQALSVASPDARRTIEERLLRKRPRSWHDIEALAVLDTPRARAAIMAALDDPDAMVRAAVTRFAASQMDKDAVAAALVHGLETAEFYGGLTQTLTQVEAFHPRSVVEALLRGTLARDGEVAVHYAAMLMYLHGKAREPFDMSRRPFFLTFHTADRAERSAAFRELCAQIGHDPEPYLS
ncbi:MAG: hypothetical protein ACYC2K_12765 [Gemmatimonadales bacterium]